MMKKLLTIVLIALISYPAFSQFKAGLKAGVSTTSLSMPTVKTITSGTTTYSIDALTNAKYGFHGGGFLRLTVFGIFIQPELLFSTRSNEYTVRNVTANTPAEVVKQNFNRLEIPVMVGFKLGPLRLNAGPAAQMLINTPRDLIRNSDFKNMYSKMTVGYQAGVGLDIFNTLTFDVRYEGSLRKYQNQIENALGTKYNLDDRANAFLFSLGLMF